MTKSEIFKAAHAMARKVVAIVGDYMVAFSYSLKEVYKNMENNVAVKFKGEYGSNFRFVFTGITQEIADTLKTRATVWYDDEDQEIDIHCTNKNEIADIELWFKKITAPAVEPKTETVNNQSRRIELLSTAVENGLNHGRSWTATAMNVDEWSLSPWFEGEQICYVYS